MLTELGKELRKMRIDRGEVLKNMADKLGMTSSYLSAIECGKRNIPNGFITKIADIYNLNLTEKRILELAQEKSVKEIVLNLEEASETKSDLALKFARTFKDIDDATALKITKLLGREGVNNE